MVYYAKHFYFWIYSAHPNGAKYLNRLLTCLRNLIKTILWLSLVIYNQLFTNLQKNKKKDKIKNKTKKEFVAFWICFFFFFCFLISPKGTQVVDPIMRIITTTATRVQLESPVKHNYLASVVLRSINVYIDN